MLELKNNENDAVFDEICKKEKIKIKFQTFIMSIFINIDFKISGGSLNFQIINRYFK